MYKDKEKQKAYAKAYREVNKERYAELQRAWVKANRERANTTRKNWKVNNPEKQKVIDRNSSLKKNYGITNDQWLEMLNKQLGRCAICGVSQSELKEVLHTDHEHATGKLRGLLCRSCNTTLKEANIGGFKATSELYTAALNYITLYLN